MGPLIGISDDVSNADGKPIERGVPGSKAKSPGKRRRFRGRDGDWWRLLPGVGWIFAHVGWSYLFYY